LRDPQPTRRFAASSSRIASRSSRAIRSGSEIGFEPASGSVRVAGRGSSRDAGSAAGGSLPIEAWAVTGLAGPSGADTVAPPGAPGGSNASRSARVRRTRSVIAHACSSRLRRSRTLPGQGMPWSRPTASSVSSLTAAPFDSPIASSR